MGQNVNFCGISGQLKNKKEEKRGRGNDVNTALIYESQTPTTEHRAEIIQHSKRRRVLCCHQCFLL